VLGMQDESKAERAAFSVLVHSRPVGYELYPVNPTIRARFGIPAYASIAQLPVAPDISMCSGAAS